MSHKRTRARSQAVQAIYRWQVTGDNVSDIVNDFLTDNDNRKFEVDYFRSLVNEVPANLDELDGFISPLLDRNVESVDLVERAVLRLGTYELWKNLQVPYRVVINEYVELAKVFGADQGHRYINGILDKLAKSLRADEVQAAARR